MVMIEAVAILCHNTRARICKPKRLAGDSEVNRAVCMIRVGAASICWPHFSNVNVVRPRHVFAS